MLKREVVEAAAAGRFAIHAVRSVDEAIELLTGVSAGVPDVTGAYPEASINGRAAHRLRELSKQKLKLLAAAARRGATQRTPAQ